MFTFLKNSGNCLKPTDYYIYSKKKVITYKANDMKKMSKRKKKEKANHIMTKELYF